MRIYKSPSRTGEPDQDAAAQERERAFKRNSFGGVTATIDMIRTAIRPPDAPPIEHKARLLSGHEREIRETGKMRFPWTHFTLHYSRVAGDGGRQERPWTIAFHGIHKKEEAEVRTALETGLARFRVVLEPTGKRGCFEIVKNTNRSQ